MNSSIPEIHSDTVDTVAPSGIIAILFSESVYLLFVVASVPAVTVGKAAISGSDDKFAVTRFTRKLETAIFNYLEKKDLFKKGRYYE